MLARSETTRRTGITKRPEISLVQERDVHLFYRGVISPDAAVKHRLLQHGRRHRPTRPHLNAIYARLLWFNSSPGK